MWELDHKESWALKNWWFWTVCWRRLLRAPWTSRSNQSILKEISAEYSLMGCWSPCYKQCHLSSLNMCEWWGSGAESEEELKSLWMKVKEESEKAGLKLNIQKAKIMTSGPITSWQIDGKQWKQWETLLICAPKSVQMVTVAMKLKEACFLKEKLWAT